MTMRIFNDSLDHIQHSCNEPGCMVCEGGLSDCTVCCGAEAAMPSCCPGAALTYEQMNAIQADRLEFVRWQDGRGHVVPMAIELSEDGRLRARLVWLDQAPALPPVPIDARIVRLAANQEGAIALQDVDGGVHLIDGYGGEWRTVMAPSDRRLRQTSFFSNGKLGAMFEDGEIRLWQGDDWKVTKAARPVADAPTP